MSGDEELERRIESALRSYAEPPEIPEARIAVARVMQRVKDADAAAGSIGSRFWMWALAAPAIACLLVLLAGAVLWMLPAPAAPEIAWVPKAPGVIRSACEHGALNQEVRTRVRVARTPVAQIEPEPLPKLQVFPTPKPLSPEEQTLVAFGTRTPLDLKRQVVAAQEHAGDPITIAELRIRPLAGGEKSESEKEKELP